MINRQCNSIRPPHALALAATAWHAATLPAIARPAGEDDATKSADLTPEAVIDNAQALMAAGKLIEARAMVFNLLQGPAADKLSAQQKEAALNAAYSINRRMQSADPVEMSLQKAQLGLRDGDLALATRHATAVAESDKATPEQIALATTVLATANLRRGELTPLVKETIEQATKDFQAGRYAQAKSALHAIRRSDVALTESQQAGIDSLQLRLVDLEQVRGAEFAVDVGSMGLMQPGVIQPSEPREQPATPPATQPAPAETQPAQPIASDTPPPAQPTAVQPAPTQGDLLSTAMRVQATALVAEADQALADGNLNEARTRYRRARAEFVAFLTPEQLQHIDAKLAEVNNRMGLQPGAGLDEEIERRLLVQAETRAEFENLLGQARRALQQGDTSAARQYVAQATLKINTNRNYFAETEYENRVATSRSLESDIAATERRLADESAARQARDLAAAQQKSEIDIRRDRERRIREFLDRARAYQREMRYHEALETVDQLLFLDPINPAGLLLRDVFADIIVYQDYNDLQRLKRNNYVGLTLENEEAMLPRTGVVNYSADWKSITFIRGEPQAFAESPENRRILADISSRRIPAVQFTDNSLEDVVRFVETVSQLNIDTNWEALSRIGVQRETPVSLNLREITIQAVLDRVLSKVSPDERDKADWAIHDGILTISSDEDLRKKTTLYIYDIRDLLLDVPDYDQVPEIDLQSALQQSGGGGGQSPFQQNEDDDDQDRRTLEERTLDIITIIQDNVDPEGWLDTGGTTGKLQQYGGSLIITQTDKNHREISGLLQKLRNVRAMQINVETRFLLVNQDWFEQIGFDIDVYLNTNNNQVRAARVTDPAIQGGRDFFNFRGGQPTTLQSGPGLNRVVTGPGATVNVINPNGFSPVSFEQDSLGLASALAPAQGIAADILNASPALGIAGQFLDDIQVDFLVTSTQADRRSIQLTAPRLTFTNGQIANIYVATQVAFVSDLAPVVGDSAVGFDPTVDVVTEGVTLLVEGVISADRRYVTMNVDAGVARIDGFGSQAVTAVAGGQLVNSADTQSFIQLPTVTVTRVRTTVTVPDQGTVLLGGQRLVTEFEVETGVPVLSKLPILNRFFSNRIESKEEQTLLILIKPTVLIQNEQEERNFPGLLDSISTGLSG